MSLVDHIWEESNPALSGVKKSHLMVVPVSWMTRANGKQATITQAPDLDTALKVMNESVSFKAAVGGGAYRTVHVPLLSLAALKMDPEANSLEDAGAIALVPELKSQLTAKYVCQYMLDQLTGGGSADLAQLLEEPQARQEVAEKLRAAAKVLAHFQNQLNHG